MQALSCGSHLGDSEADFPSPGVLLHGQLPKLGGPGSVLMHAAQVGLLHLGDICRILVLHNKKIYHFKHS